MKLTLKEKVVYGSLATVALATFSIILWEQVRDQFFAMTSETVEVRALVTQPQTIDGLIREQAESWLKSPEAMTYAKEQVTAKVIEDLSKL